MIMIELSKDMIASISKAIIDEYPKEMCGVIIDNEFVKIENVSNDPEHSFILNPIEYYPIRDKCRAIIHSHCQTTYKKLLFDIRTPSYTDYIGQKTSNIPWYIYGTDGTTVYEPIIIPRVPF